MAARRIWRQEGGGAIITIPSSAESGEPGGNSTTSDSSIINKGFGNTLFLMVESQLNKKDVSGKTTTYSKDFFRDAMFYPLIEMRAHLMKKGKAVDAAEGYAGVLQKYLLQVIPNKSTKETPRSIGKATITKHFVTIWKGLRLVLCHPDGRLDDRRMGEIGSYVGLMERTVSSCEALIENEKVTDSNAKSIKMSVVERDRGFMKDGAVRPIKVHRMCAKCDLETTHYPPENKAASKSNTKLKADWKKTNTKVQKWLDGTISNPPLDGSKPIKNILPFPTNKMKPLLIVCKASTMTHSLSVDGYKCKTCVDRSCDICKSNCSFICSTL